MPPSKESAWQLARRLLKKPAKGEGAEAGRGGAADTSDAKLTPVTVSRLMQLVRPEAIPMGASIATLGVTTGISLVFPYYIGKIMDSAITELSAAHTTEISLGLLALFVVQSGLIALRSGLLTIAGERIAAHARRDLFRAILNQEVAFFDTHRTGDLLTRLSADTGVLQKALTSNVAGGLRSGAMAVGGTVMLFVLSPKLALLSLALIPPVAVAGVGYGRYLQGQQRAVQEALGRSAALAEEVVSQVRTVRQFAREGSEAARYGAAVFDTYTSAKRIGIVAAYFDGAVHMAANVSLIAVLGYGGSLVASGALSPGDLTAFLMYSVYTGLNAAALSSVYSELKRAAGAAGRVFEIIDRVPAMPLSRDDAQYWGAAGGAEGGSGGGALLDGDGTGLTRRGATLPPVHLRADHAPTVGPTGAPLATLDPATVRGDVEFDAVQFAYPTRPDVGVLRGFSLRVPAGTSLALVGGSGSGKSTVGALLTRLYDPTPVVPGGSAAAAATATPGGGGAAAGAVRIDGVDIRTLDPSGVRAVVGVVAQEPALFAASIRDNIAYGAPGATDAEVTAAAVSANAHDFIAGFPAGYATLVGERGVQLSGGQRQRVALARAILKSPRILLLDEATSALDAESEAAVMEALDRVSVGRTVITIAHRLSTMRRSDLVAVLADGRVVETGRFEDLFADPASAFRALVERQMLVGGGGGSGNLKAGAVGVSESAAAAGTSEAAQAAA